jgi:hypothetical protein
MGWDVLWLRCGVDLFSWASLEEDRTFIARSCVVLSRSLFSQQPPFCPSLFPFHFVSNSSEQTRLIGTPVRSRSNENLGDYSSPFQCGAEALYVFDGRQLRPDLWSSLEKIF